MWKKLFLAGLALSLPLSLAAVLPLPQSGNGSLLGHITDAATGEVIREVQVSVPRVHLGAMTNVEGKFLLKSLPLGQSTLLVEHPCYHSVAVQIVLSPSIPERTVDIGMPYDVETANQRGCDWMMKDGQEG